MPQESDTQIMAKDAIGSLTVTAFPAYLPQLISEGDILRAYTLVPAAPSVDEVTDPFNATDWADVLEPSVANRIMYNLATRQFKMNDAMANGDLLIVEVVPAGSKVRTT